MISLKIPISAIQLSKNYPARNVLRYQQSRNEQMEISYFHWHGGSSVKIARVSVPYLPRDDRRVFENSYFPEYTPILTPRMNNKWKLERAEAPSRISPGPASLTATASTFRSRTVADAFAIHGISTSSETASGTDREKTRAPFRCQAEIHRDQRSDRRLDPTS